MPVPYIASMPEDMELTGDYTVRVTAIDPSTGNHVSGVNVSAFVLTVATDDAGSVSDLAYGPFMLVPGPDA